MNEDVKKDINKLAGIFAVLQGYEVPPDYDFQTSPNHHAMSVWQQAKISYEFWSLKFIPKKKH